MTNRATPFAFLPAVGLALALLPTLALGQTAAEIMERALEAQAERLSGIENITIVQEVMGMETAMYMEKRDMNGTPVLFPVSVSVGGMENPIPQEMAQTDWASPFQEAWVERAQLVGEEELDGVRVSVLAIDDFSGLEIPGMPGGSQASTDLRPTSIRFWIDTEDYLTRKVAMDMQGTGAEGAPAEVHMELFMEDYREVEGYVHPFVTRSVTEGMMEAADLDQEEIRAQLEEMKAQLESMPEAQRAMVEGMMSAQIERLEGMLGEGGGMEMTITVKDIKVNAGPPGGGGEA